MAYVKWTLIALFWLIVAGFLHYTLPQTDIARITDTYESRTDTTEWPLFWSQPDSPEAERGLRDVFFMQTRRSGGDVMVYRNEDTGWGWPPYFKFDTANLQAEAADMRSTSEAPRWVAIKHYGWRNEFISIYPNAISVRPVAGPDVSVIPWTAIVILIALATAFWALWVRWRRFRARRIDPALEAAGDRIDDGGAKLRGWLGGR